MAELYAEVADEEQRLARGPSQRQYWDRKTFSSFAEQQRAMARSSTLYIGNLSFFTSEAQIYELFSRVGHVKRVIMGLDRFKKTPCGFCFVEYSTHAEAEACAQFLSETKLDNRVVRCEMDGGFREGRQFGRGLSGGQVRDDRRSKDDYDAGRGGYGRRGRRHGRRPPLPPLGARQAPARRQHGGGRATLQSPETPRVPAWGGGRQAAAGGEPEVPQSGGRRGQGRGGDDRGEPAACCHDDGGACAAERGVRGGREVVSSLLQWLAGCGNVARVMHAGF